jgi:hypothetical protein
MSSTVNNTVGQPPRPLPLCVAKAGINHLNWDRFELIKASDIAKPYQIYVKQRSRADVNSPYRREIITV